jgi:hypothetical protein
MDVIAVVQSLYVLVARRVVGVVVLAALAVGLSACSDESGPIPSATPATASITQTAASIEFDVYQVRLHAEETATLSPRTPVPTALVDACKLLTKEEVVSAIGKPMEQTVSSDTGRCIYQGDGEFLSVTVYSGMSEVDAKKLFNFKYIDPSVPSGPFGNAAYSTERTIEHVGDETMIARKPHERAGSERKLIYVRKGNQLFYILWLTTVIDRDVDEVLIGLAVKVIPRL